MSEIPSPANKSHSASYRDWMDARDVLSHAVQRYVAACSALADGFSGKITSGALSLDDLKQTVSAFDTHMANLSDEENTLRNAHLALLRSRNNANFACPISRLPRELLSEILMLSYWGGECPVEHGRFIPMVLASVCRSWRQLVLDTPFFWSHLDLEIDIPILPENQLRRLDLWRNRFHDAALTVDLMVKLHPGFQRDMDYLNPSSDAVESVSPRPIIWDLAKILAPIANQIVAVKVTWKDFPSVSFLQAVVGCFAVLCNSGNTTSFILQFQPDISEFFAVEEPLDVFYWDEDATVDPVYCVASELQSFMSSVDVLGLGFIALPENDVMPINLKELSLSNIQVTLGRLAEILESSPSIRRLSLIHLHIDEYDGEFDRLIHLPTLEHLTLLSQDDFLLSGLAPGNLPLGVHIDLDRGSNKTREFFARSNVDTLHVEASSTMSWFSHISSSLGGLKCLTLESAHLNDNDLRSFLHHAAADGGERSLSLNEPTDRSVPWPQLHSLSLVNCDIDLTVLIQLAALHSVQKFRFIDHRKPPSVDRSWMQWMLELMECSLSKIIPDCKFFGNLVHECCALEERLGPS